VPPRIRAVRRLLHSGEGSEIITRRAVIFYNIPLESVVQTLVRHSAARRSRLTATRRALPLLTAQVGWDDDDS
jgi:hypothetical protein